MLCVFWFGPSQCQWSKNKTRNTYHKRMKDGVHEVCAMLTVEMQMIFHAWSSEKWVSSCVNVVTLISRYLMVIIYGIDPDYLVRCVKKQATKTHYFNVIRHVSLVLLFLIAEVTIQLVSPPCPNILGNTMINPTSECSHHHQSIHSETWLVWNGGRLVMSWFQNGSIHWKRLRLESSANLQQWWCFDCEISWLPTSNQSFLHITSLSL